MKLVYRTYDLQRNTLHWRLSGEAGLRMLCGNGNFLDWKPSNWGHEANPELCQECEVRYVLEMMT